MGSINYALNEISSKIVYCGPVASGKSTNLRYLHQNLPPERRGDLVSLAAPGERTLFFDFLPIEGHQFQGFKTKFQVYAVPGLVAYNATKKLVLKGVDGIVFVCDSQWDRMRQNLDSFRNLQENLASHRYVLDQVPFVFQYNKRDLAEIAPVRYLEYVMNPWRVPCFEANASLGVGVLETLECLCRFVLANLSALRGERQG